MSSLSVPTKTNTECMHNVCTLTEYTVLITRKVTTVERTEASVGPQTLSTEGRDVHCT